MATERGMMFAVADGMGGASAGEYASRMAAAYPGPALLLEPFQADAHRAAGKPLKWPMTGFSRRRK